MSKTRNSKKNIENFTYAIDPSVYDDIMRRGKIDYAEHYRAAIVQASSFHTGDEALSYLLTLDPGFVEGGEDSSHSHSMSMSMSRSMSMSVHEEPSPVHCAAYYNKATALKLLIDFDYCRKKVCNRGSPVKYKSWTRGLTPFEIASYDSKDRRASSRAVHVLQNYWPTYGEKLASRLACKLKIDSLFEKSGREPRFKKAEIDLKFQPISAVLSGDLHLLMQSLPHVDQLTAIPLTIVAFEKDHSHLLGCLCDKLRIRSKPSWHIKHHPHASKLIGPLLYSGLDRSVAYVLPDRFDPLILPDNVDISDGGYLIHTCENNRMAVVAGAIDRARVLWMIKSHHGGDASDDDVEDEDERTVSSIREAVVFGVINRARVLCVFKILYHKFIYLNIDSIFQLTQMLLYEGLHGHIEDFRAADLDDFLFV